jgi:ABC-type Fe3+/spermidine/putrescine transport system ATPase subunit
LDRRKFDRAEVHAKVATILEQVGLSGFEDRLPSTLSGGQQQRVALARSAVLQPRLLLLDEPLSNLDAKLREQMRDELREMIKMFGMTAVHITHDQAEAMALADRLICMRDGRIEQIGTPRDIYRAPANRYVAEFIGAASFLEGPIVEIGEECLVEIAHGFRLHVAHVASPVVGASCLLAIRPEAIAFCNGSEAHKNVFTAKILHQTFLGAESEYVLELCGQKLKARSNAEFPAGSSIRVHLNPRKVISIAPPAH